MRWLILVPFFAVLSLTAPLLSPAAGMVTCNLRPQAEVAGEFFYLDEIASLRGWDGERIEVGRAPLPGRTRLVTAMMVRTALYRAGLDRDEELTITGDNSTVTIATQTITGGDLVAAAEQFLRAQLTGYARVELVARGGQPGDIILPRGPVELQPSLSGTPPYLGRVTVRIAVQQGGATAESVSTHWEVTCYDQVVVADNQVRNRELLSPERFHLEERALDQHDAGALTDLSQLAGMWAGRTINPGSIVTSQSIAPVPAVVRGSRVTITAMRHGIIVTAAGEARQDGFIGDSIRAINIDSGRQIEGEIANENTLVVR